MDTETKESYRKAGKIAAEALAYGKSLIKKGELVVDVCDKIEAKIKELGGEPAFPAQISLNETAAHYCPDKDDDLVFGDDVVCLDVGAHVDGYIGDNACSIDLSGKNEKLIEASQKALEEAEKILKVGIKVCEIGKVIEETIKSYGFEPVRNLSGHGLDQHNVHTKPTIPNFDNGDETRLEKGMAFAIEPFATTGNGLIEEKGLPNVYSLFGKKSVRLPAIRKIMLELEKLDGMPFTRRWLYSKFTPAQVKMALMQFKQLDILKDYPPLVERTNGLVSQAENSFIVDEKIEKITKI